MRSKFSEQNKDANRNDLKVDMKTVDSFLDDMEGFVEELISNASQLPKVDKNGYSECPFAEELYARKEKAVKNVEKALKELQQFRATVKKEVDRCRHNLNLVGNDSKRLRTDQPKEGYDRARKAQVSEYNRAIMRQKKLFELFKRANEALKKAKEKKWPFGKPKSQNNFNPQAVLDAVVDSRRNGIRNTEFVSSHASRPSFNRETNNLLSLNMPVK
jgi:hypothetical protein